MLQEIQREFSDFVGDQKDLARLTSFARGPRFAGDESQHQFALAADWQGPREGLEAIADNAKLLNYRVVWEADHLHIQRFDAGFLSGCGFFAFNPA